MIGDELLVVDPFNGDGFTAGGYSQGNYAVNPTVSRQFSENYGNPKNNKYTLTDVPGQTIRLTTVDGKVLYEGAGADAVNKAADIVDALNQAYGPGATWKLQTKPEGASDFSTVSQDTVAKQKKTALNSFLDVALPLAGGLLVPGLGLLGGVAGAAAGAGGASLLNSALQNQSLDDAVKTALINAAGAGAGNYLGGQLSGALQGAGSATGNAALDAAIKGQGALINAGTNFANSGALDALAQSFGQGAIGSAVGTVSPVIINAATQGALGGALGSGLGSLVGSTVAGAGGSSANTPNGSNTVDEIVVTPPTTPPVVTPIPGVTGGATPTTPTVTPPTTPNVVDEVVVEAKPNTPTTPVVPVAPTTPTVTTPNVVDEVVVTPPNKPGTVLQDLGTGLGTIVAGTIPGSLIWVPPSTTPPTTTPDKPTTVDEVVVTAPPKPPITTTPLTPYVPVTPPVTQMPYVDPTTITQPGNKPNTSDVVTAVLGGLLGGGGGGGGSKTSYTSARWDPGTMPGQPGSLSDVFRGTLPTVNMDLSARNMADRDWTKYGFGPEASFFNNVPERNFAKGGYAVRGPGTGRSDSIKANLSDGEYVVDAETVALLGDGSSKAGARKLDELRVKVRKAKGKDLAAGKFSVKALPPERYISKGR